MKILEKGQHPDERTYRGECLDCGTKVEFLGKEGKRMKMAIMGLYYRVTCPVCDNTITVRVSR